MRVSELAKELGYRAAELVEMAKSRGLALKDVKDMVDARSAAVIRAQVPPRAKLTGAAKDLFVKVQADLALREAEKPVKEKKEPVERKPRVRKEKPAPVAGKPEMAAVAPVEGTPAPKAGADAPAPVKPKTTRKQKVVAEFHLGTETKAAESAKSVTPSLAPPKKKVNLSEEELREIRAVSAKPLLDVDKVIGEEKDIRVVRTAEIDQLERGVTEEEKERRRARAASVSAAKTPVRPPAAPTAQDRNAQLRRTKPPPMHRPTVSAPRPAPVVVKPEDRTYEVTVPISLKNFSQLIGVKANDLIRKLMTSTKIVAMNTLLSEEDVTSLSIEFHRDVKISRVKKAEETMDENRTQREAKPGNLVPRPPIVTVLGHVDHGKTSLLDRIRNTTVAAGEAGGITQHIGASKVKTASGKEIVFLDTPGHEAFTAMRARGAKVTDLVVLVVAADDGVMPQTEEAYSHAKAAGVPVVVAINKCDKKEANLNKVKGQLATMGLQPEDWGGQTTCVELSALTGNNVDKLIEMLGLEAELLDLKADPKLPARGVVLEARRTDERGPVATVVVQDGTLRKGDVLLSGRCYGRVRSMHDDRGRSLSEAPPATPVEISGLDEVPEAGERFQVLESITQAKEVVEERRLKEKESAKGAARHVTLEGLFSQIESGKRKEVKVVLKADTRGSLEVLTELLQGLSTDEVKLVVLHGGIGTISEADVLLADASDAIIVGFYCEPDERGERLAKDKGVQIRHYKIIYEVIEDMKAALEGLLEPEKVSVTIGHLAVKEIFRISRVGSIAGCLVMDGKVERGAQVKLIRNGKLIHEGKIETLKRFKDDVKEVQAGYECGMKIAGYENLQVGDVVEAYTIQEVARRLEKKKS